jgi:hypothetical protein
MIASIFSGGVTPDPYYEYTTLLLPGNGTNGAQNNTFLDGSTNNFTITRNGNTTQGTFSPFSQTGWGNYFNGSSYLSTPGFNFSTSDFTIEFFINGSSVTAGPQPLGGYTTTGLNYTITLETGGVFKFYLSSNGSSWDIASGVVLGTATAGKWHHIVIVRSGNSIRGYFDGTGGTTTTSSAAIYNNSTAFYIGAAGSAGGNITGYFSNVRVLLGTAAYSPASSTITVPTAPFATGTTNQVLLTCQANRFVDSNTATTAKTITRNGSPAVVAFSPFNPTASWSAATYGGSGYFDGSGDSLSVASNTALQLTGEFTMEAWYYPVGFPGAGVFDSLIATGDNATSSNAIAIYISSSGGIQLYNHVTSTAIFNTASGVVLNAWNHIAATRNSSNGVDLWLNGVSQGSTVTVSSSFTSTTPTRIGTSSINQDCYGYISNARIVKGTAVYTSAFTPPTAPLTAITNTSLLLNFTNAGIYDATSKNDLETLGNAQISTAISAKWGSGSIKFNGTTDYLDIPPSTLIDLGGGDWTFEGWVYPSSLPAGGSTSAIVTLANPIVGGFAALRLRLNSSGTLELYMSTNGSSWAAFGTTSAGISAGQWSYIAVVRSGSGANNVQVYVNGTSRLSLSLSGTHYVGGKYVVGCTFSASAATEFWNGYMQDLRLTKGYARTITASPTAAFPTQ